MKKIIRIILITFTFTFTIIMVVLTSCGNKNNVVLRVYNSVDHIDPAVIEMFERETGIEIFYNYYNTNEDLYNQVKNMKGYSYDVVFPSDYMVKKMSNEGMLAELNYDNIPNYANIDVKYDKLPYDKKRLYSVPYIAGTLCLAYNPDVVTQEEVKSWDVLWNEKFIRKILMMNSERDSMAIALKRLGYSMNSKKMSELNEAKSLLLAQKPFVLAYTYNDVKEKMIKEEGALALILSCDIPFVKNLNPKLKFTIPQEGTNLWWNTVCILKESRYKEEAEMFINFLCREDIALKNAEYLESSTPNKLAYEKLSVEIKNNPVVYLTEDMIAKSEVFEDLADYMITYSTIWKEVIATE